MPKFKFYVEIDVEDDTAKAACDALDEWLSFPEAPILTYATTRYATEDGKTHDAEELF